MSIIKIRLSWEEIYKSIQQDLKFLLFMLGVFSLFRIAFIIVMRSYISEAATLEDILTALYYGSRISLKSAGSMVLVSFAICLALHCLPKTEVARKIRLALGGIYISVMSILFYARIPYYEQFHMAYNQLIFNTLKDDVPALFQTLLSQYQLPSRLLMSGVTAVILFFLFRRWLDTRIICSPRFSKWYKDIAFRAAVLTVVYYLAIFLRFGGGMTYAYNIDWENSGVTKDQLLNEAILDDMQALYRAYELHERIRYSTGLDMDPEKMAEYGNYLARHSVNSANLDDYLKKQAQGSSIQKPKHIFLIIGESYANWPLLPQYKDLNIANGVRNLINQENAAYTGAFLPNGMSTISGVMGVVTGLAEANLYLNYLPESYKEPYATAIAPQMKRLGYKPQFWYAGPSSWEQIKDFTLAQGFEKFHGMGDYESVSGNVWGNDDKYLFQAVTAQLNNDSPSFNIILTVSNHAPYTVDLTAEGFDADNVRAGLPEKLRKDEELIKKLGHFWYADKMLAEFIQKTQATYPDSLFLIVGDHADRLNIEPNPSLYERYAVPFVLYGQGIQKKSLSTNAAGSHINVTPTLLELIAPKGFTYYSLGDSLTRGNDFGMNYGFWITNEHVGRADNGYSEMIAGSRAIERPSEESVRRDIDSLRALSWWRIQYGKQLKVE